MKFGFSITGRGPLTASEAVSAMARRAEELEFDLVLAPDHLVVPKDIASTYPYTEGGEFPGGVTGEAIDQLTTLAFMAGQTSRIRLGTSVMIVPHRNRCWQPRCWPRWTCSPRAHHPRSGGRLDAGGVRGFGPAAL